MIKRISTVALSIVGAVISVLLFFHEPLEYFASNKYAGGGTEYTYSELLREFAQDLFGEPMLTVIFAVTFLAMIFLAVLVHLNIDDSKKIVAAKCVNYAAYLLTAAATFTVYMPGEGFEILAAIPFFLGTAPAVTILFIVSLIRNKSKSTSLTTTAIASAMSIGYTSLICGLCDEIAIGCASVLSIASLLTIILFYSNNDEEEPKSRLRAVFISVFCILLAGVVAFGDMYLYCDNTEHKQAKERGYTYVGNNDGKEKERAHFSINGFEGYYAYKTKQSNCIPYRNGDICLVESYDFSSENIVVPATLNGKKVMLREIQISDSNEFFRHLAENRDKFKTITIADGMGYTVKDNKVYDSENQRIIYLYFGNEKSVTVDSSVSCIDEYAFAYSGVEKITFEDGVGQMRGGAFAECPIKELTLPDGMVTIGSNNSILGAASKLQKVNLGKECNIWTPLGDFDENVRRNNENDNVTLTVNTESVTDLYDLGDMIYNYPKVELNLNMSKEDYIDNSISYGISDKMLEKIKNDGDTITFSESHVVSGVKTAKTEVTINFA